MIIEQLENIANGGVKNEDSYKVGIGVNLSGHLLSISPRINLPTCFRVASAVREKINKFSESSAQRMRRYLRESIAEYNVLITLTYPGQQGYDGERAKRDLKVFMQRLRRTAANNPAFSAFWFLEFQGRGSIHFHIFTNQRIPKERLALEWYEICGTEDKRHLAAGTRIEKIRSGRHGISAYAAKYAAKHSQKVVPDNFGWCGRFWGVCGDRRTASASTFLSAYDLSSMASIRSIKRLQDTVETLIFSGQAKYLQVKRAGVKVVYIKDQAMLPLVRMMIDRCNISCWYPRGMADFFDRLCGIGEDISND